jgi:ABC-2 type transport system permease protein
MTSVDAAVPDVGRVAYAKAFYGLMVRDGRVLRREFVPFLLRVVMNPLLFVFVFTYVFPKIGRGLGGPVAGASFATILVPGLIGVAVFFQGIAAVALPLATELGGTREIEDRLMAPLPIALVAFEKVVFSTFQSVLAAIVVFPLLYLIPAEPVSVTISSWPLLVCVVLIAGLLAGFLGLLLGTVVQPRQIGLIFSLVVVPITFLGCVYYPWQQLSPIPWLKVLTLFNPLVYVSEGLRAAMTPSLPHMPVPAVLTALIAATITLGWLGTRSFTRRVTD